jgi:hypothetical protein
MAEVMDLIWGWREGEYFCEGGWTGNSSGSPSGKSVALEASVNHAVLRDTRSNRTFAQCLGHIAETIERQFTETFPITTNGIPLDVNFGG